MAKIDPAFQAAPFLGESSYNPIEFARRHKMEKFQIQKKQQEDQARNTAKGLEDLMLEVKGWEDKKGFESIMAESNRIKSAFIELSSKGMNLVSPKSTQEVMAYKTINDAQQKLKEKLDTWNQNKGIYDLYIKGIQQDSLLPEDQQKIDKPATMARLDERLKTKDLLASTTDLQNLVVTKTQPVDVYKDILANKDIFEKGTVRESVVEMPDGSKQISSVEDLTPQQIESNAAIAGRLYESKPQSYKDAIKKIREADPDPALNVMSDKDYFKGMAVLPYKQKFMNKPVGSGGSGSGISFGGTNIKYEPTERQSFRDYTTYHPALKWPTQNIPVDGVTVWKPNGEKVRVTNKTLQLQYTGYDENTDQATFITESNYYGGDQLGKGDQISIQMDDLPPKFKDIEVLIEGKKVKIKDVKRDNTTPMSKVKTIGGIDFSISIPPLIKRK